MKAEYKLVTKGSIKRHGNDGEENKLYQADTDIVPRSAEKTVRTEAYAVSGTEGVVIHANRASGFGKHVVVVETPKGNHVIYGHDKKIAEGVNKGLKMKVGQKLGIIGYEGMVYLGDSTKWLHLHVDMCKGKIMLGGKRLGIQ